MSLTPEQIANLQAKALASAGLNVRPDEDLPVFVQKVPIHRENPLPRARNVLEGAQERFTIWVDGRKYMFTNYEFETDDDALAQRILDTYTGRIWRLNNGE